MSGARSAGVAALLAAATLAACATNPAPAGWLPRAENLPQFTRGAWAIVHRKKAPDTEGELIAAEPEGLHVLTREGLRFAPGAGVESVRLALYAPDGAVSGTSAAGALSTLTHGWYFPLTIWFWFGPAIGESNAPLQTVAPSQVDTLRKYSRFPQGLPAGLAPEALGNLLPGARIALPKASASRARDSRR